MKYFVNFLLFLLVLLCQFNFGLGFFEFSLLNLILIFFIINWLYFRPFNFFYFLFLIILTGLIFDFFANSLGVYLISCLLSFFCFYFLSFFLEKESYISKIIFSSFTFFVFNILILLSLFIEKKILFLKPIFYSFLFNLLILMVILFFIEKFLKIFIIRKININKI